MISVTVTKLTPGLLDGTVSGIMGLAFSSIASTHATPFWQALSSAGQLSSPELSFWLTRADPNSQSDDNPGGVFTLGGTNSSLFTGDIDFNNIPANSQASFWLQGLSGESVFARILHIIC